MSTSCPSRREFLKTSALALGALPDPKLLDALPTDPHAGGPFVMWKGTPYAHVMVRSPRWRRRQP